MREKIEGSRTTDLAARFAARGFPTEDLIVCGSSAGARLPPAFISASQNRAREEAGSASDSSSPWRLAVGRPSPNDDLISSKVDSGKSGETSGACLPTGRWRKREIGSRWKRKVRRMPGNESPVTCMASGVEMSDLSARARWRVSSPVDHARSSAYTRRTTARTSITGVVMNSR
ncbi:hypothetical protein KM043_016698 [Ampulex compressa]|nr:hypothetical protein KM043_016698 [Ampulex compressa]